jgi:ABC-type nitrate/sulfonate/bicarbonate transport system substrate-binding protein
MNRRLLPCVLSALVLAAALSACGAGSSGGSGGSGTSAKKTFSFIEGGSNDFSDADQLEWLALLKQEGYTVNVSSVSDAATALRAVIAHKADFFIAPPTAAMLADINGNAQVKAVTGESQASDYVILALPKYNMSNLDGATMAIASPGTAGQVTADTALSIKGINTAEIHNVTVGDTSARVAAILSGRVDLSPVLAASAVPALETKKVKILLNTGTAIGAYLEGMLVTSESYLQQNSATVQVAVNTLINAMRWASTDESGYISLINANKLSDGLTATQEQAAWKAEIGIHLYAVNGGMCASTIARTLSISYQTGALPRSDHPVESDWLDRQFVDKYLQQHHQPTTVC